MSKKNNKLRAISHEAGQYDSFHFTTAVFDEIGEVPTRQKISKITSGQVKVKNSQFIQISTAYPNPNVPFHDDERKLREIIEQDFLREADNYLCLIWAQDDISETYKPETWVKNLDGYVWIHYKGYSDDDLFLPTHPSGTPNNLWGSFSE